MMSQMGWLRYKISVETASVTGLPEQILHLINQTLAESVSQTVDAFKTTVQRDEGWPHSDYPNGFTMEVGIKVRGTWAVTIQVPLDVRGSCSPESLHGKVNKPLQVCPCSPRSDRIPRRLTNMGTPDRA